ncbi:MAG: amidohydrolase family protein [Actinomycetota bacterium]
MTQERIDLHCHFIPPALLDRIAGDGGAHSITITDDGRVSFAGKRSTQRWPRGMRDLTDRLERMDAQGVHLQIISAWMDFAALELSAEDGAWLARCLNELTIEAIASHGNRFRAMAAVPLQAPELAAEELRYALGELGMVAVEIATTLGASELDDPGLAPFWAAAEELDALVLVHPIHQSIGFERLSGSYFLDNIASNPAESTVAAANLIFGGVLARHPGLKVCLTHGGGFLPYQIGRLDRGYEAKPDVTAVNVDSPPSAFLRRFYYDTVLHSPEALRFLVDRVGADRVVLGSDYPFPMGDPDPVRAVLECSLEDVVTAGVLGGNAIRALAPYLDGWRE